jgi:multidrug efflux pump subunit AcrA (membrane-fusion protein)
VKNPGNRLKPRMLASVTVFTKPVKVLGVPPESLVFDTDGYYAFVKSDAGLERRKVEIVSWTDKGVVRVHSGLKDGETIAGSETVQLNALWHRAKGEGS